MSFAQRSAEFFREIPVTKAIILLWAINFLLVFVGAPIDFWLAFDPVRWPNAITGLVTYPLMVGGIIGLLINGLMLYMFGGSLERSWGARAYVLFLLAVDIVAALCWFGGLWLFGEPMAVTGTLSAWMMLAAVIVAWAWLNPDETIMFWFVLPLQARWIGWLTIVLLNFSYASQAAVSGIARILLGFFALGGVGTAWAYVWYRRRWGWIPRRPATPSRRRNVIRHPSSTLLGALSRPWREWQRRRRIAYLQRTIVLGDDEQGKRN